MIFIFSGLRYISISISGEGGIRTPGSLQINGFQDRRDRPLCHLSFGGAKVLKKAIVQSMER
jgi:hypothetical protein